MKSNLCERLPAPIPKPGDKSTAATKVSDALLVRRARAGDQLALARLWQRHEPYVRTIAATTLPRTHVEDLVQEVALAVLGSLPSLRNEAGFGAWVAAIARNRARSLLAGLRRRAVGHEMDCFPAREPGPTLFTTGEIRAALAALPPTYRRPLTLRLLIGMSGPEIADRVGMTPGSVRVNLCRGLKLLRRRLEAE